MVVKVHPALVACNISIKQRRAKLMVQWKKIKSSSHPLGKMVLGQVFWNLICMKSLLKFKCSWIIVCWVPCKISIKWFSCKSCKIAENVIYQFFSMIARTVVIKLSIIALLDLPSYSQSYTSVFLSLNCRTQCPSIFSHHIWKIHMYQFGVYQRWGFTFHIQNTNYTTHFF